MRVLLESITFLLHIKNVGIFRIVGIIKDHLLTIYWYNWVGQINHFQILILFLVLYYFMDIQLHRMGAVDGDLWHVIGH